MTSLSAASRGESADVLDEVPVRWVEREAGEGGGDAPVADPLQHRAAGLADAHLTRGQRLEDVVHAALRRQDGFPAGRRRRRHNRWSPGVVVVQPRQRLEPPVRCRCRGRRCHGAKDEENAQ